MPPNPGPEVPLKRTLRSQSLSLTNDLLSPVPVWAFGLLALAAVFLRFDQLTTLSVWPHEDEAMNAHYAIELAERGYWQWTYDFSGMPPLYIWGLGLFFKAFGVSLATLWAFPALLSSLAVGLAFLGARKIASPSFCFLFTALLAVGFWPLYVARFSVQGGFLVFWECLTFWAGAAFWKRPERGTALVLGLLSGGGFYTFPSWAVVAFLLTLLLGDRAFRDRRWDLFLAFFLPQVLLFLPLAVLTAGHNAGHFHYVFQDPFQGGWRGFNDLFALFTGSRLPPNLFAYRPFWGGFLNPLLGLLCLGGVLALGRMKPGLGPWKWGAAFFLLILPGFLTGGLDAHRIVQVLLFLFFTASAGLFALLSRVARSWRWPLLAGVLLVSAALDHHHLFGVYHSVWSRPRGDVFNYKSIEYARAYSVLEEARKEKGPGLILTQLVPDTFDQSLDVATHSFNVLSDPEADPWGAHWAALVTNVNYGTYLQGLFPAARCQWLSGDAGRPDGGWVLALIPLPSPREEILKRWIEADRSAAEMAGLVYDNHDWKPRGPVLEGLKARYFLFQGDPFLESVYWEKVAQNEYMDRHYEAQLEALKEALALGVPAAHLYNDLGALYLRRGRFREAQEAYRKALACRPNVTTAAEGLAWAREMEKNGKRPID
jgi:hypothetical protein